jgi:hypothetical protein
METRNTNGIKNGKEYRIINISVCSYEKGGNEDHTKCTKHEGGLMSCSGKHRTATKSTSTADITSPKTLPFLTTPFNKAVQVLRLMPQNGVTSNQYMNMLYMSICK